MTITEAVKEGAARLKECNVDNAEYDSFALLADIIDIDRTYYLVYGKKELDDMSYKVFCEYIKRRCCHEPLQHILGKAWFYGNEFLVDKNVLVPRPDTEILIEEALKHLKPQDNVLDMCTGSGCIILTLALNRQLNVAVGADLSEAALNVADKNAKKLNVSGVKYIHSDLFANINEEYKFDMIVSNPPYIETAVIETLSDEVRLYDPKMALDGMADGLHFYRLITEQSVNYISNDGRLIYEIGYNQAEAVKEIMAAAGYADIQVIKDYSGLDRVVSGRFDAYHLQKC